MMPAIHSMRLAVRPSRSALMIGMPPATAASNATITPFACAAAKISLPCRASSALLAVTTCLPCAIASSTSVRAGSMPPISSTTMSMSGCATHDRRIVGEVARRRRRACLRARGRACASAIHVMRIGRPARRAISSSLRRSTSHVPPPTVPKPEQADLQRLQSRAACHARASPSSRNICLMPRIACRVRDLVLDHREAHVVVAVLAEADARRHRDLRLREQLLRELERAQLAIRLGNLRPHVHRRLRDVDHPAGLVQPLDQHVAALLVLARRSRRRSPADLRARRSPPPGSA